MKRSFGPHHGSSLQRGLEEMPQLGVRVSREVLSGAPALPPPPPPAGRFGRLFDESSYAPPNDVLHDLAERMREEKPNAPEGFHPTMPAGMVFLGQFIDHDMTFDPVTLLSRIEDPAGVQNFRTAGLDLDNVYGAGPDGSRHLFDLSTPTQHTLPYRLLIDPGHDFDLPRNSQGAALIGDPRNDENFVISQLQLAFLKFHNAVVDWLDASGEEGPRDEPRNKWLFRRSHEIVLRHYQWIVLREFMPFIVGDELADDALTNGCKIYDHTSRVIPVEFSAAAYRLGHSLIREGYVVQTGEDPKSLFQLPFFGMNRPFFPLRMEWWRFFELGDGKAPQYARKFDTQVVPTLFKLPFINPQDPPASLPERNLLRGKVFKLPSGQEVFNQMKAKLGWTNEPYTNKDFGVEDLDERLGGQTPLWFYILGEAMQEADALHLGSVGGRIVAEVLVGLIKSQPGSILSGDQKDWKPFLPSSVEGAFTMADLLRLAKA